MSTRADAKWYRWDDLPREPLTALLARRFITAEKVMVAQIFLKKGCVVPRHAHPNEQVSCILEGRLRFWIGAGGEEERLVAAGEVLAIPSNLPHKVEALEDSLALDIFSPPRQDWLDGTDAYLRQG